MRERYMMVEAVADADGCPLALVTDPEGAEIRRFVGCERDPARDGQPELREKFRCVPQVRKASHDLKSAVSAGDLLQLGPVVVATSRDEAESHIRAAMRGSEE